jgi:hypothetical protein
VQGSTRGLPAYGVVYGLSALGVATTVPEKLRIGAGPKRTSDRDKRVHTKILKRYLPLIFMPYISVRHDSCPHLVISTVRRII